MVAKTKIKILEIDDLNEVKKIGEKEQEQVLKNKIKKENQSKETLEITREKITKKEIKEEEKAEKNKEEEKNKEFPEFEIAFDPFADQSSK